ncbi:MAG: thioredoxin family protein [Halobacteriota archaeon]
MNHSLKTLAALALLIVLIISISGCTAETSGNTLSFAGGWSHPSDITTLLKKGPVLLYFGGDCKSCAEMKVVISHLETKYNGTDVTTKRIDTSNDTTHKVAIYGISSIPATIVIRSDGAVAKSIGTTDEQTLINTIENARQWK